MRRAGGDGYGYGYGYGYGGCTPNRSDETEVWCPGGLLPLPLPLPLPLLLPRRALLIVNFIGFMVYGIYLLHRRLRTSTSPLEKERIRYLFAGFFLIGLSSITNIVLVLGYDVFPVAHVGLTAYCVLAAYAVVRYRLLDIVVVVRRTFVYAVLTVLVAAVWVASVLVLGRALQSFTGYATLASAAGAGAVVALVLQPAFDRLQRFVDRRFFRERTDWASALDAFARTVRSMVDRPVVLRAALEAATRLVPVKNASVMIAVDQGAYVAALSMGPDAGGGTLARADPIVGWLESERRELLRQEIVDRPSGRAVREGLLDAMDRVGGHLVVPLFSKGRLVGLLVLGQKRSEAGYSGREIDFVASIGNATALALENTTLLEEKTANLIHTIEALARATEVKDRYAHGHAERIERYAVGVGRRLGMGEEEIEALRMAARLYDVGKIAVSDRILGKAGLLSPEEREAIKAHPAEGWRIVGPLALPDAVREVVLSHHERLDGSGYPDGLAGEEGGLASRILGAVDAFVAMTSDRPYRKAHGVAEALEELERGRGAVFDARVVDALRQVAGEQEGGIGDGRRDENV